MGCYASRPRIRKQYGENQEARTPKPLRTNRRVDSEGTYERESATEITRLHQR